MCCFNLCNRHRELDRLTLDLVASASFIFLIVVCLARERTSSSSWKICRDLCPLSKFQQEDDWRLTTQSPNKGLPSEKVYSSAFQKKSNWRAEHYCGNSTAQISCVRTPPFHNMIHHDTTLFLEVGGGFSILLNLTCARMSCLSTLESVWGLKGCPPPCDWGREDVPGVVVPMQKQHLRNLAWRFAKGFFEMWDWQSDPSKVTRPQTWNCTCWIEDAWDLHHLAK
jgi:hypothetical protein